ncbi:hypothetical protein BJ138DRAFT_1018578, partial [Hygrophoropsis aurantiaca]
IPAPSEIKPPAPGLTPAGYWVITVGQEVGIFFQWSDVADRTHNISGNIQSKHRNFTDALAVYTHNFNRRRLKAVPIYGGPYWRMRAQSPTIMPSPTGASSDEELWDSLEDLSQEMSQVSL